MAITIVNTPGEAHNANSTQVAVTITASAAGNLLVAGIAAQKAGGATPNVSGVTDGGSQTWVQAAAARATDSTNFINADWWFFKNTASGIVSVTVTLSSFTDAMMTVWEIAGCSTTSPQDGNGSVLSDQNSANPTGSTKATAIANDIILSLCITSHGISGGTANGFTATFDHLGNNIDVGWSSKIVSATGTYGTSWTAASGEWVCATAAFGDNVGGGSRGLFLRPNLVGLGGGGSYFINPLGAPVH